jgi:hypothetical protein
MKVQEDKDQRIQKCEGLVTTRESLTRIVVSIQMLTVGQAFQKSSYYLLAGLPH